ncbi:hypothetical protein OAT16_11775 [Prolixibacteraceae bacterium]|nr:hypothetical protein [Prolixibacteraceae bacterium]
MKSLITILLLSLCFTAFPKRKVTTHTSLNIEWIKQKKKKVKVRYNQLKIKIPTHLIMNRSEMDTIALKEYCVQYLHGTEDARRYKNGKFVPFVVGFSTPIIGIASPMISSLVLTSTVYGGSLLIYNPKPEKNRRLMNDSKNIDQISNSAYREGYRKSVRRTKLNAQLAGIASSTAVLITFVSVIY